MFNKSLGSILSQFTKVQQELDMFIQKNEAVVGEKESKISSLKKEVEVLQADNSKATEVRKNLDKLLSN